MGDWVDTCEIPSISQTCFTMCSFETGWPLHSPVRSQSDLFFSRFPANYSSGGSKFQTRMFTLLHSISSKNVGWVSQMVSEKRLATSNNEHKTSNSHLITFRWKCSQAGGHDTEMERKGYIWQNNIRIMQIQWKQWLHRYIVTYAHWPLPLWRRIIYLAGRTGL